MATFEITHTDGRQFIVAEQAFKDLYEPFGFKPTAVVYGGERHAYTKENVEAGNAYDKAGFDPNQTYLTLEAESRQAADRGETDRADELMKQSKAMAKEQVVPIDVVSLATVPDTIDGNETETKAETAPKASEKPANAKA